MKKQKSKGGNWDNSNTAFLCRAFLAMKNEIEMKSFLRDLLTENEIIELGHRIRAAELLKADIYYDAIAHETGLSSRTIARVKKWLKGNGGGYRTALARVKK
ncbi:DNA-binding transcriptional regulator [Patescibacteria group bacterium]|nr:DNA-binding transcriptional regulator [Patescibacteria group bacterium]